MKVFISVIIPVYNVEEYLRHCIDSVINQTYKNLEILLIDDGSTDNSGKICDEYALKDNRIKVIHKTNGGVSSARNLGLDIATGDYIGFVDSDDFIEKDMYEFLYNLIIENNADISCCNRFDFINNKYLQSTDFPKEGFLSLNEILQDKGWGFSIWTKLFNKNLIKDLFFNENLALGEDFLFCFEILKKSKKTVFKNVAKYYYRYNQSGAMQKKIFKKKFLNTIYLHDYIINYTRKNNLFFAHKKFFKYKLNWIISLLIRIVSDANINGNKDSLIFLLKCAKKNLYQAFFYKLGFFRKSFFIISCINFNLASRIYKLMLKLKVIK